MARRSALFSAAGRLLAKPAMRPLTRFGSALHARLYPYFTEYQQRTSREIPVVILSPET